MKKASRLLLAFAAGSLVASAAAAQTPQPAATSTTTGVELKVGDQAPDFTLPATDGKTYTLSKDLKGKWVVLAWFPKAFTAG
jgi:cytochrome oxidase Cu insertion factor (SCO1/SenC/PrrC family)